MDKKLKFNSLFSRMAVLVIIDLIAVCCCALLCYFLLHVYSEPLNPQLPDLFIAMSVMAPCFVLGMTICGAYQAIIRYSSITDFFRYLIGLFAGTALYYVILSIINALKLFDVPLSEVFGLFCLSSSYVVIIASRVVYYYSCDRRRRKLLAHNNGARTLIIGAGEMCRRLLAEMKHSHTYCPICIVDDDKSKLTRRIEGIPVLGTTSAISDLCIAYGIDTIFFAIPSCSQEDRKRILRLCSGINCRLLQLPYISDALFSSELLRQSRSFDMSELLDRPTLAFDKSSLRGFASGKRCLITGGGGSVGAQLARHIAELSPECLIIVDSYENNVYQLQQEFIAQYGSSLKLEIIIASVSNYDSMREIFKAFRPQLVFHAAGHKHVPFMERTPAECVTNNVIGVFNVASLAGFYDAEEFVFLSSSLAASRENVLGEAKACCERIVLEMAATNTDTHFTTVRFGNVIDSSGSVIDLFEKQIQSGLPVTITHPEAKRYFVTLDEAATLILQAASIAKGGETFVLDMGEPIRITEIAEKLIKLFGKLPYRDVPIIYTGLREGETADTLPAPQLNEMTMTENPRVYSKNPETYTNNEFFALLSELKNAAVEGDSDKTRKLLRRTVE